MRCEEAETQSAAKAGGERVAVEHIQRVTPGGRWVAHERHRGSSWS